MLDNIEQLWSCCSDGPNITDTNVYWTGLCHFETFHAMVKKNNFLYYQFFFKKKFGKDDDFNFFYCLFLGPKWLVFGCFWRPIF